MRRRSVREHWLQRRKENSKEIYISWVSLRDLGYTTTQGWLSCLQQATLLVKSWFTDSQSQLGASISKIDKDNMHDLRNY